jgi:hypothetical protein
LTTRELTANVAGPVTIDAELLQHAGKVTVRVDQQCQQATLVVSTRDEQGPAAGAVQRATLNQSANGVLSAKRCDCRTSLGGRCRASIDRAPGPNDYA